MTCFGLDPRPCDWVAAALLAACLAAAAGCADDGGGSTADAGAVPDGATDGGTSSDASADGSAPSDAGTDADAAPPPPLPACDVAANCLETCTAAGWADARCINDYCMCVTGKTCTPGTTDDCPDMMQCRVTGTACYALGDGGEGDPCPDARCSLGLECIGHGDGTTTCQRICDPASPPPDCTCNGMHVCDLP